MKALLSILTICGISQTLVSMDAIALPELGLLTEYSRLFREDHSSFKENVFTHIRPLTLEQCLTLLARYHAHKSNDVTVLATHLSTLCPDELTQITKACLYLQLKPRVLLSACLTAITHQLNINCNVKPLSELIAEFGFIIEDPELLTLIATHYYLKTGLKTVDRDGEEYSCTGFSIAEYIGHGRVVRGSSLVEIDLKYLGLESFDGIELLPSIETCETLNLAGNLLTDIPDNLGVICPALKKLDLSHNPINEHLRKDNNAAPNFKHFIRTHEVTVIV